MCGRFTLKTPAKTLSTLFDEVRFPRLVPRYNIAPTQNVVGVRQTHAGTMESAIFRWGLVPSWAKDLKIGARMINARSETVATKPSFRSAFKKRRCLVLADGFYEWKKLADGKQPYYICRVDDQPFCLAGLWEAWTDKATTMDGDHSDSAIVETCTILTTTPNELMAPIHDRMPVILSDEAQSFWLDTDFQDQEQLEQLLIPCPTSDFQTFPVSKLVNKPANDEPACVEPI